VRNLRKMPAAKLQALRARAAWLLAQMDQGAKI
jgi:hypothetical protein